MNGVNTLTTKIIYVIVGIIIVTPLAPGPSSIVHILTAIYSRCLMPLPGGHMVLSGQHRQLSGQHLRVNWPP